MHSDPLSQDCVSAVICNETLSILNRDIFH